MVGNERGGQTAANSVEPHQHLPAAPDQPELYLTQLLVNLPDTPVSQLDAWLPDRWLAARKPQRPRTRHRRSARSPAPAPPPAAAP